MFGRSIARQQETMSLPETVLNLERWIISRKRLNIFSGNRVVSAS
jgi:hypothetical protein